MASITSFTRHGLLAAGLSLGASAAMALPITIPTTFIDAETTFKFNSDTADLMSILGIGVSALGNTVDDGSHWNFMMPVTQVSLNVSLFSLKPLSGAASGSGLLIHSDGGALSLANFGLDFKRNVLTADLGTVDGKITKSFDVFSFTVTQGLHLATKGGLSMQMQLDNMMLTQQAQSAFTWSLALDEIAQAGLPTLNFGSLSVDINPSLRFGLSSKPLVSPVPEPSSWAMLAVGMLAIAAISRRRQQA
jgi:PEP-CTERM motif